MSKYSGFIIVFDEARRAEFLQELSEVGRFSDVLSAHDWHPRRAEICFLSYDQTSITAVALARRGRKVATAKYRIDLSDFIPIEPPIPLSQLERQLGTRLGAHLVRSASGSGGRVPPATWTALLSAVIQLRPGTDEGLRKLERLRSLTATSFSGRGFTITAQEKDAVGLALAFFGANRRQELSQLEYSSQNAPAPFLRGLSHPTVIEDRVLEHDARVFGNWAVRRDYQIGAVEFHKGDEILTVQNVNRTRIEHTLGVDLFYYHHKFQSYVMVQYKCMTKGSDSGSEYRPDKNFRKEIKRMEDFIVRIPDKEEINVSGPRGYRLNSELFYFKFCPSTDFDPMSMDLMKGMYIPLNYLVHLLQSNSLKGPRGGIRIKYENAERHFDSTHFVNLVEKGWIGSRLAAAPVISDIIRASLDSRRSVILARSRSSNTRL